MFSLITESNKYEKISLTFSNVKTNIYMWKETDDLSLSKGIFISGWLFSHLNKNFAWGQIRCAGSAEVTQRGSVRRTKKFTDAILNLTLESMWRNQDCRFFFFFLWQPVLQKWMPIQNNLDSKVQRKRGSEKKKRWNHGRDIKWTWQFKGQTEKEEGDASCWTARYSASPWRTIYTTHKHTQIAACYQYCFLQW